MKDSSIVAIETYGKSMSKLDGPGRSSQVSKSSYTVLVTKFNLNLCMFFQKSSCEIVTLTIFVAKGTRFNKKTMPAMTYFPSNSA